MPAASLHGPICINAAPPRSDKPVDAGLLTAPRRGFIDPLGLQPTCLSGLPLHQWGVVYWEVKVCVCHGGGVRIIVSSVLPLRHIRAYWSVWLTLCRGAAWYIDRWHADRAAAAGRVVIWRGINKLKLGGEASTFGCLLIFTVTNIWGRALDERNRRIWRNEEGGQPAALTGMWKHLEVFVGSEVVHRFKSHTGVSEWVKTGKMGGRGVSWSPSYIEWKGKHISAARV